MFTHATANRFAVLVGAQDNEHQELGVFKVRSGTEILI
jgi:hypothetical protein